MIEINELEFTNSFRSIRGVRIVSSMVGQARLTSYKLGNRVVGLVREYKGLKYFYRNA